jgi:hypothetical protein
MPSSQKVSVVALLQVLEHLNWAASSDLNWAASSDLTVLEHLNWAASSDLTVLEHLNWAASSDLTVAFQPKPNRVPK